MITTAANKIVLLVFFLLAGVVAPASSVDLSGNWSYAQDGGDTQETTSTFQQRYQLGVGPSLTYQPTRAITVSGGIGYRNTQRDSGNGRQTVEQLSPFGQMSLVNDIFIASLSANSYTTMSGNDTSTSFWNASLLSAWDMPFWPRLTLNYGEDFSGVEKATFFDDSNGKVKSTSILVDWDLQLANLFYQYSLNQNVDKTGAVQSDATTHYARFDTRGRFLDNRISVNLTEQYRASTNEFNVEDSAGDASDLNKVMLEDGDMLSYVEDSVTSPDPADVLLVASPALGDGNFVIVTETVAPNDRGFFGVRFPIDQQIDSLSLFLDPGSALSMTQAEALQWALYIRDPATLLWEQLSASIPFVFIDDFNEKRFEFSVGINGREVMLVTDNPIFGGTLLVTELQAFRFITENSSSESTNYITNVGARYQITSNLNTGFSLMHDHYESETNNGSFFESDKTTWSGRLQWSPTPYLSPSINYSEHRETETVTEDRINRSYSLSVSSRLLPSLNAGLSFYHYDRYLGDEKTFSSDNYSLYVKAAIYPDLSASLSTSYIISDTLRQVVDDDDLEGVFRNQKAFNSRMDVTAKLHRKLTGYLTYNYNIKDDEISGKAESANGIITLSYQPSDLLAMQGSYRAFFFDSTAPNVLSGSMELFLLRTSKSRLTLKAAYSQDDTQTINTFGMLGSWNISDYLSLTTSGNYFLGQDSFYSFNANLSMRL